MDSGDSLLYSGLESRNGIIDFVSGNNRSGGTSQCPDIDFVYADSDTYDNEIAELYSYTEGPEFKLNLKAFEDTCVELNVVPLWHSLANDEKKSLVIRLTDHLELCKRIPRMRAARAILYIAQGCWGEVQSDHEQKVCARENIKLLVQCGIWSSFVQLLHLEIDFSSNEIPPKMPVTVSLSNSTDLRVILSVLYTILETLRIPFPEEEEVWGLLRQWLKEELVQGQGDNDELLSLTLLGMVTRFCNSSAPHFPIRKVLLLLWKVFLFSLGGTEDLKKFKVDYRNAAGLDTNWEDTLEVSRTMRASTPPISAGDLIEQQINFRRRSFRKGLMKQSSLDDSIGEIDLTTEEEERPQPESDEPPDLPQPPSPRPGTPTSSLPKSNKGLPWAPKVRQRDIDMFLDCTRMKFVGFPLQGDRTSLVGLPQPIHEGVSILSKHIYVSLAEVQIKREEEITKNPMSRPERDIPQTAAEVLYQAMLPSLPQCMIALLKILLAAAPTSKSKTDSINIMADVLPEEMPMCAIQSLKLSLDVNRHKEILVKSVSAILLILLKHFKVNHIYQFEFMSQHLVFANCVPLILKFFNQNSLSYVQAKHSLALLDFPALVIGDPPEMTPETLEETSGGVAAAVAATNGAGGNGSPNGSVTGEMTTSFCCWRNMFSCINLLRILNKLCKWKPSRIMMLVVFKSAPILKRTLKVRHAMMQLYVLKLLKMQTKYLGRQWRKTNMKTLSAIYQKVRHRLNDDWAYGNDPDARPWDFQSEESALRACVDRFNNRRYNSNSVRDPDFEPVDNCITSVLGRKVELTEEFKKHYDIWLQQEVLSTTIEWDQLLTTSS